MNKISQETFVDYVEGILEVNQKTYEKSEFKNQVVYENLQERRKQDIESILRFFKSLNNDNI